MKKKKGFVKLTTVYGPVEGEIVKAKLQSEGIDAILQAESLRSLYGIHLDGLGKVEIWVKEEDKERAKTLLALHISEGKEG